MSANLLTWDKAWPTVVEWPAIHSALSQASPEEMRQGLPELPPSDPDPIGTAAFLGGLRAVRVSPATLTTASGNRSLVIDSDGRPVVLPAETRRSAEEAASDRMAWRLYPRLPRQVADMLAVVALGRSRPGTLRVAVIIATSLAVAAISGVSALAAILFADAHRGRWVVGTGVAALLAVTALLVVRDRAALAVQRDLQARLEPALWDRVLARRSPGAPETSPHALVGVATSVSQLRSLVSESLLDAILALAMVVVAFTLFLTAQGWLAAGALGLVMAAFLLVLGRQALAAQRGNVAAGKTGGLLQSAFTGLDEVHLYARETAVLDRVLATPSAGRGAGTEERLAGIAGAFRPLLLVVTVFACWQSHPTPSQLIITVCSLVLLALAFERIDNVARSVLMIGRQVFSGALEVLRAESPPAGTVSLPRMMGGGLECSRVSLTYPGADRPAVDRVSLRIAPGEFVAIVGASGSGKSALLRLIAGMESPDGGEVRLDGTAMADLVPSGVRAQIGFVRQDADAPRGSVRSVVLGSAGRPVNGAENDEKAWAALRTVGLEGVVRALPMALSTVVSGGSGGFAASQLQQMSLARELAREPRLLLLDEPVAAMDAEGRQRLVGHVRLLPVTRVLVTHSPQLARAADRVIVLADGAVVESGPYDELIAAGGPLTQLFPSSPCDEDATKESHAEDR